MIDAEQFLADLEVKAKAATPGPWKTWIAIRRGYDVATILDSNGNNIADMEHSQFTEKEEEFNAAFIVAANPAAVLRLVGMVRAAVKILNRAIRKLTEGDGNVFSLGMTCPHCDMHFSTVHETVAHDAACPKHPASIRAERLEKEIGWLTMVLANASLGMPLSEYIEEDVNGMSPPAPEHWRDAARKACEEQK